MKVDFTPEKTMDLSEDGGLDFLIFSAKLVPKPTSKSTSNLLDSPSKVDPDNINTKDAASSSSSSPQERQLFENLGLEPFLLEIIKALSLTQPTPVQNACIPPLLSRSSPVIGVAKTGSGKTAAFALPIIQNLSHDPYGVYAVILTPTRELAIQIAEQFKAFSKGFPLQVMLAIGGVDMMKQASELASRPHILIATPGRLADLLLNCVTDYGQFKKVSYLIFDEADRLLGDEISFGNDLRTISEIMRGPNTLLAAFTATITDSVKKFFPENTFMFVPQSAVSVGKTLEHRCLLVPSQIRDVTLYRLLSVDFAKTPLIIFVNKCLTCELLRRTLGLLNIKTAALHSQLTQQIRLTALSKFRSLQYRILIATDVAARGLDIPEVALVINYDVPADHRDYVHRVGRTARAGRSGTALTLVGEMDIELVQNIEAKVGVALQEYPQPDEKGILDDMTKVSDAKRLASMALREQKFGEKRRVNKEKWEKKRSSNLKASSAP
jgi:ATP-dependent RNA helicase DDX49/DBP8